MERSASPDERRHKKVKSDHYMAAAGGKESRKLDSVAEVDWDSGGLASQGFAGGSGASGWDGTKSTSTVEQLTRHSLDKLGNQVRSWDGGENSIDASSTPGGREKIIRDSWDQQLDRGKMKDGKTKTSKSEFSSDKNFFQEQQNKRNKGESQF